MVAVKVEVSVTGLGFLTWLDLIGKMGLDVDDLHLIIHLCMELLEALRLQFGLENGDLRFGLEFGLLSLGCLLALCLLLGRSGGCGAAHVFVCGSVKGTA